MKFTVAKIVDYFKDPENFSILLFMVYVIMLMHLVGAAVLTMCLTT